MTYLVVLILMVDNVRTVAVVALFGTDSLCVVIVLAGLVLALAVVSG